MEIQIYTSLISITPTLYNNQVLKGMRLLL